MKKRKKTIKRKMFEMYATALLVVVMVFIIVYTTQTYRMMQEQLDNSMIQLSQNVENRLDDEIRQISNLSERITFSKDVRELFFKKLPNSTDAADTYRLTNQLNEILYGIIGPKLGFYHMNIVNLSGHRLAFGQEYNYRPLSEAKLQEIPWLETTIEKGGKLVISPTMESVLNELPKQVISLSRGFGSIIGGSVEGAVEIQMAYEALEELMISTVYLEGEVTEERKIVILDKDGSLVYPLELDEENLKHYQETAALMEEKSQGRMIYKNPVNQEQEHIFFPQTEHYGWKVILIVPDKVFSRPLKHLVMQILLLSILMLVGVGIFSTKMSRVYSEPIDKLYKSVKSLTLDDISSDYETQIQAGVDELEQLNKVFNKMVLRIHESLEEVVKLKNMEMHSRMLALQAQMNPHFLYNTLTVISIMADNEEKSNVQWACRNLSDMLSYISSEALHLVPLKDEMSHTKNYMNLIKMRFMDDIKFLIDVSDEMDEILIPKLVIQPLIENSVKYATATKPVWEIQLSGWTKENQWFICVKDNGIGFSKESLLELDKELQIIQSTGNIPELSLNGMGILNIYLRMNFYYKEKTVFKIENCPDHGASILIGGLIDTSDTV